MGLRLGKFGKGPEVSEGTIRFGWDYQFEHEHGLSVDLSAARWTTLLGFHVLVIGSYDDAMVIQLWECEGTSEDGPVWILWKKDAVIVFFRDLDLATTVEMAVTAGRARISYEGRIRKGQAMGGDSSRRGEGVLSWTT